jgi:hypothetical protein
MPAMLQAESIKQVLNFFTGTKVQILTQKRYAASMLPAAVLAAR